jgi:MinD superfamily P-loop ATPase
MKQLVIISGKGGTGKTSIVAALSSLSENKVIVDCDVDAADMHLILDPKIIKEEEFIGGKNYTIDKEKCNNCSKCEEVCRFDAIGFIEGKYFIKPLKCESCGVCAYFCPIDAIDVGEQISGKWFISDTRNGTMVHARLNYAEDNSGKLVAKIREEAKIIAEDKKNELILIDGPPGIGCPVIASLTGTDLVLFVTEPTVSGIHDLKRIAQVVSHFKIKGMLCINKFDLNSEKVDELEDYCEKNSIEIVGKIPYDTDFTKAQISLKTIIEYSNGTSSTLIKEMWGKISNELSKV